jgi:aspartate/tyrosine/aromatic aminotransferase
MFQTIATAPPDPILGLTEAFRQDPRTDKINLSVGVFQDESGTTPILETVKEAERRLVQAEKTKNYRPITGDPEFGRRVRELLFGADSELCANGRAVTAHTPGGTGALRVVGDYLKRQHPQTTVWMSDPTWPNHPQVFAAAGLASKTYPYFDKSKNGLALDAMLAALAQIPAGDCVLLHACCHNPTGVDLTDEQWEQVGKVLAQRDVLPIVDFAYQGFASGVDADASGVRVLLKHVKEMAICSSYSKNFGLYNERTGALTMLAETKEHAEAIGSQIKVCVRANYSNPPAHGGAIITTILADAALVQRWEAEVAGMRDRIAAMRALFVKTLKENGVEQDFSFLTRQNGMFSFSGLNPDQVKRLRDEFGIYIVGSGRISVAGMAESTMPKLCAAIAAVLA